MQVSTKPEKIKRKREEEVSEESRYRNKKLHKTKRVKRTEFTEAV